MPTLEKYLAAVAEMRAKLKANDVRFYVPPGTRITQCTTCKTDCYWGRTGMGKPMLVDCHVPNGAIPTKANAGLGAAHFATCPCADQHRRAKHNLPRQAGAE
jgi:hypothetical protein